MGVPKRTQAKSRWLEPDRPEVTEVTLVTVICSRCGGHSPYSRNDMLTHKPCVHCDWGAVTRWMRNRLGSSVEA